MCTFIYRKEHLKFNDWMSIMNNKTPISIEDAYNKIIYEQYNLNYMNYESLRNICKWSWNDFS